MGKQHKRGVARTAADVKARHKRPCISAPSAMANFSLHFHRVERNREKRWNAKAKWDPVTTDVAGRTLPKNTDGNARADGYQIELQACDASGDPVDLPLSEEDPKEQHAKAFTDVVGTSTIIKTHERRLNTSGDVINSPNITGLTAGIEESVEFFARCESGTPNIKMEVWNQTDGNSVVSKTQSVADANLGKLVAKMKWTPVAGKTYRLRVTWQSGSGKPILTKTELWDAADDMTWKKTAHDEDTKIIFKELVRPKVYYYRARGRARINHHHRRCWSAWTAWTTAINPVTGNEAGMDPPDGLVLKFSRTDGKRHNPFIAEVEWNEAGWWIPPMGDAQEGSKEYGIKLASSADGGSSTLKTRRKVIPARDNDGDTTAETHFDRIRRNRHYRAAVRSRDHDGNWGAWSAWTSWLSPKTAPAGNVGNGPDGPLNVTKERPKKGVIVWDWDPPANKEEIDYYRVKVYGGSGGGLKKTHRVRNTHYRYNVPDADMGTAHHAEIAAVDDDGNTSSDVDPGSETAGAEETEAIGSVKKWSGSGTPGGWLRCNGASYSTSAPYADLFAVIGYTYGGAGASFNVPDFRKRKPRGVGDAETLGDSDGEAESSGRDSKHPNHGNHQFHAGHDSHNGHGAHQLENTAADSADHVHPSAGNGATININQSGQNYEVNNSPTTGGQKRGNHEHPQSSFQGFVGSKTAGHHHGHNSSHDSSGGVNGHGGHNGHAGHNEHGNGTGEHDNESDKGHKNHPHLKMHFIIKYL